MIQSNCWDIVLTVGSVGQSWLIDQKLLQLLERDVKRYRLTFC